MAPLPLLYQTFYVCTLILLNFLKLTALRYYGITYTDIQKIYIDEDLPQDCKRATLIHELTHCYIANYITHRDKQYCEEDVADIVSNSFDTIREIVTEYFEGKPEVEISMYIDGKKIIKREI